MSAASAQARKSGTPVVVNALTTPTWLVTAKPGGGYALSGNPQPVRAKQNGAWVPVSTALHHNTAGTISAAATAYGTVEFSGGGAGPMVTTTNTSGASYQLTWPGALPVPSISGDTATYSSVLPGVDLKLTANATGGFSDVLVVHNAAAAANPKLQSLTLAARASGGLDAKHGVLAASRDGMSLQLSGGLEWDSNTTPNPAVSKGSAGSASQTAKIAASDPSTAAQPGIAAHTGALGIGINSARLSLRPDMALLKAKNAAWPAYIDPTFQWHPASGATPAFDEIKQGAPCNGVSDYDNSSASADSGQLGVGYVTSNYSCDGIQRAYYQWQLPSIIDGGQIGSATVEVAEVWQASFNCSFSHNVNLHWSTSINGGTSWNTRPSNLTGTDSYSNQQSITAAWNGTGCPNNGKSYAGFPVGGANSPLQISANNHFSQITFGLTDDTEESAQTITDFARFSDNPTLNIAYGHVPPAPSASQLSAYVNSNVTSLRHRGALPADREVDSRLPGQPARRQHRQPRRRPAPGNLQVLADCHPGHHLHRNLRGRPGEQLHRPILDPDVVHQRPDRRSERLLGSRDVQRLVVFRWSPCVPSSATPPRPTPPPSRPTQRIRTPTPEARSEHPRARPRPSR